MNIDLDKRQKGYLNVYAEKVLFNSAADKGTFIRYNILHSLCIFMIYIALPMLAFGIFAFILDIVLFWAIAFLLIFIAYVIGFLLLISNVKINYVITEREIYYVAKKGWQSYKFGDILKVKQNAKFGTLVVKTKQKMLKKSRYFLGSHVNEFAMLLASNGNPDNFVPLQTLESEDAQTSMIPKISENHEIAEINTKVTEAIAPTLSAENNSVEPQSDTNVDSTIDYSELDM